MPHRSALAAFLLAAAFAPTPAPAAEAAATQVFEAEWFASTRPRDAADMVRRLPGFTIAEGDEDVRGYAAAQGNVLIDGARPASKREDIGDLLGRIPADTVERIELIRGGAGVDMAGHAVLANIVRRAEPPPEGAIEAGVALAGDGDAAAVGALEYARRRHGHDLEAAYERDAGPGDDAGDGRIALQDADGDEFARADTTARARETEDDATLAWRRPAGTGTFALDAALRRETLDLTARTDVVAGDGLDDERAREEEDLREAELALRWERERDGRRLTTLASRRQGWLDTVESETEGDDVERFAEDTRTSETLASIVFGADIDDARVFNAGFELADNRLDGDARLSENGEPVPLPGARVHVEEQRGEASAGLQWSVRETLRLDAGLRVEHSRLRHDGDGDDTARTFTYVKPRVALDWQATPRQRWRASIAREVGQLDFGDFVADASLADDEVTAGNDALAPDTRWRTELAWEAALGSAGSLVLTAFHEEIDDVVDRVPVVGADGEVFDAPGNLGDGRRDGLRLELGVALDALGLRGMRLDADVLWQRSRVRDPATGDSRRISGDKPLEGSVGVEQTFAGGDATWGVAIDLAEEEREYRVDEVSTETESTAWMLYGERRFGDGWRVRAELSDADGQRIGRVRDRWDGPRDDGAPEEREVRSHRTPGLLMLTLRREFGG